MGANAVELEGANASSVAADVRRWALRSIASAIAIGPAIGIGALVFSSEAGKLLGVVPWLLQIVFGLQARSIASHELRRIESLGLPVPLAEAEPLRKWSKVGVGVALFGIAGAVVLLLGFLWLLVGLASALGGAWGRPLRVGGEQVRAKLGSGTRWADGPRPQVDGLDAVTRGALGRMWLHDAIKEHGSVPAFAQLSWELAALGAPASLLARCQTSALQEISHAQRCFAAVEAYLDTSVHVDAIAAATGGFGRRAGTLRCAKRVALETLEDGCLIEDLNADFAERAHVLAVDPAISSLTATIAREEREHAELAWDILAFCIALHPEVARAVRARLARLPTRIAIPYDTATATIVTQADPTALAAHGRVPFAEWLPLFEHRRAATILRAEALLDTLAAPSRARAGGDRRATC